MLSRNLTDISRSLVTLSRPGYRMTETGEIPEEWDILPLTKVAKYINGMAFKPSDWKKQGIPIVRIENLNDSSAPFNYFDEEVDNKFLLNDGDILLSWSASLGVYIWNRGKAVLNQHIFKVVPNETVNKYYLFWALHNSVETLSKVTHGSTMKHFQKGELERTKIALPSLSEQQKIAEILFTADETIQKVNEEITLTEKLKKGLMQTLLTKGIGHTKFKMTEIGEIPEEWEISKLDKIFNIFTGTTPSTKIRKYWHNGSIEWLTPKDLGRMADSIFISSSEKKITPDALKECSLNLIPKGSILISTRAPVGYVGVSKTKITFNQGCKGLVPIELNNIDTSFYAYYLAYKRSILVSKSSGSTFKELSKESLANFDVPVPPLPEQQKIAEILTTVDHKLELLRNKKTHLERLKKGLMEDLLTGRVRVKI